MMATLLRSVGAIVAGIVIAIILAIAVEAFTSVVHPFPEGFGGTFEEVCRHVEGFPAWVLAAGAVMWGITAFAATWTAGRIGGSWCALALGLLLLAGVIMNIAMLPYAAWFKIASPIAIALAGALGYHLSSRRGSNALGGRFEPQSAALAG